MYKSLQACNKSEVVQLFHIQRLDVRSTFGRNCQNICEFAKCSKVDNVRGSMLTVNPIPEDQAWRLPLIKELLDTRNGGLTINYTTTEDITTALDFLCYT